MNLRALVLKLAGSTDSPQRTAAAFALGTFLSFSPFIGLQVAAGMALAFLLRLNRPAVLVGLCTNLPWIVVPWYTLATVAGGALLNRPVARDFGTRLSALFELPFYRSVFWERAYELVSPFFWSFIVGSTLGAALVGVATYFVTAPLLARWQRTQRSRAAL